MLVSDNDAIDIVWLCSVPSSIKQAVSRYIAKLIYLRRQLDYAVYIHTHEMHCTWIAPVLSPEPTVYPRSKPNQNPNPTRFLLLHGTVCLSCNLSFCTTQ